MGVCVGLSSGGAFPHAQMLHYCHACYPISGPVCIQSAACLCRFMLYKGEGVHDLSSQKRHFCQSFWFFSTFLIKISGFVKNYLCVTNVRWGGDDFSICADT